MQTAMQGPREAGDQTAAAGGGRAGARGVRVDAALRAELDALYADAAAALDERRYDDWVDLFDDDCRYVLQPRENFDRGLPLATLRLDSKGMLRDRVRAVADTLFHAPYYQRHVIGPLRIVRATPGEIEVEANYAVFRTGLHEPTEVFNVGRYLDTLVRAPDDGAGEPGGWRIRARRAVFDSELVRNSVIYPI